MATRRTEGAICLTSCSHLPPIDDSMLMFVNPVTLPPGRASDATKPLPTGSETWANTIGSVRVSRRSAATVGVVTAKMTSGCSATNSFAEAANRLASPAARR
jgi:hypothetical protein